MPHLMKLDVTEQLKAVNAADIGQLRSILYSGLVGDQ